MFTSTIHILKVNEVAKGISKKTGAPWERHTAETMLLDDDGGILEVGKLNIPPTLREGLQTGIFRAGFSLAVAQMGDQKGEIVARLVSLQAAPKKSAPPPSAASQVPSTPKAPS